MCISLDTNDRLQVFIEIFEQKIPDFVSQCVWIIYKNMNQEIRWRLNKCSFDKFERVVELICQDEWDNFFSPICDSILGEFSWFLKNFEIMK